MKKTLLFFIVIAYQIIDAQTTQDTINNPYWQGMMFDRSISIKKTKRAFDLFYSNKVKVAKTGYKQFERWYEFWSAKCDQNGNFPSPDNVITEYRKFLRNNLTPRSASGSWSNLGPLVAPPSSTGIPIGTGRINVIGFHPTDASIVFCGAPQGGFWRSTNKGVNWISSTDNLPSLGVSAIGVIPSNPSTILIGTGDRDANDATGLGVYKSTNGGVSFVVSNSNMGNVTVNRLLVNPLNHNTIIAGTSGGLFISYNQGTNWTQKSSAGNFKDIVYCPGDTTYVYGTVGGTFYRSTNGGNTWASITSGFSATARNRMAIAVTAHNPNIVYIVASNAAGSVLEAVYKSSNKGTTFTQKATTPSMLAGQGWYDIAIESSATDSNLVYVGGLNVYKSTDGATSFTAITDWTGTTADWVHADIHFLGRNPINNELWIGTDGAVDYTADEGNSFIHRDNGLSISQIYNLGVSQKSKTRFITGLQDNGTLVGSSVTAWNARIGGDGMHCEISNFDTTKMFGTVQYGDLRRSTNGGSSWTDISSAVPSGPGPWVSPYHLHPRLNDIMVMLYVNASVSKNIITSATPTFTALTTGQSAPTEGSAIRFSNINDSIVFMGWSNGVFKYANILDPVLPVFNGTSPAGTFKITDIETSFNNENVVYATAGNRVYKSSNKGTSWTDISSNLPIITTYSIVLDKNSPEGLYVGTEAGVYYKDSLSPNWSLFNNGLPANSEIRDLEIVYDTICSDRSVIYAATYGRGLWKGDLRVSETQPNPDFTIPATSCITLPVNITNTTTSILNNGATTKYKWTISPSTFTYAGGTDSTSPNPIVIFNAVGNYNITLRASKPYGGFCTITKNNIISLNNNGNIVLKTTNDTTICPGDSVLISLGGMQNYNYTPMTNVAKFNDSLSYVNPIVNTNYMIIGDINGACLDTAYVNVKMKLSPNYNVSGAQSFCNGDSTTINIANIDTAYWSPLTGVTDISPTSKKVKISSSSVYNLRLVKAGMCDIKMSLPILVKTIPNFSLSKSFNQTICLGDSTVVNETNAIPMLFWMPTTNVVFQTPNSFRFKPSVNIKYMLRTMDTTYCSLSRDSIQFTVIPKPTISVTGPSAACAGAFITLNASGADTFKWSPATHLNKTEGSSVISNPTASVLYTVTGITGPCSSTTTKTIGVGPNSITLVVTGDTSACLGSTFNLTVSGADTFKWSPANFVSNEFGKTVRISANSTTPSKIKVVGETTGCIDSMVIPLYVRPLPNVLLTKNRSNAICQGEKVSIKGYGANNYLIQPIYNVSKPKFDSFVVNPAVTTTYFIFGTNNFGCQAKDSTIIDVNPLPVIVVSPSQNTVKRGDSFQITASGGAIYEWTPNKYIKGTNISNSIFVKPDSDIVYSVNVTTSLGCTSKGMAIVYIQQNPNTPSSILSTNLANILIYPNPAQYEVNIVTSEPMKSAIYSMGGALIYEFEEYKLEQKLNVSELASGFYFLSLETKDGIKKLTKIEITK